MNTGTVSVRYAKALLTYAIEQADDRQVYAEMQILAERLRSVHAIHERLADPTVRDADKCRLLETAVTDGKGRLSASASAFFSLVVGAGRGDCLLFMATSYQDLYRRRNGIVPVQLITAAPVGDERRARLKQLVENVEHGKVEWTHTIDPSIEGGFVLLVDGYRLDASVAWQLQRIRKELIEKNNRII
ncbi:MAG: F0F1 ATP synthase subunit delta [Bacteroidaceae bacterium]|nr:F0F1 ATP synthase subunit delta [Bacteroidaceae bacterium]